MAGDKIEKILSSNVEKHHDMMSTKSIEEDGASPFMSSNIRFEWKPSIERQLAFQVRR